MGERDHDRDRTNDTTPTGRERLTVSQAAAALGISAEAVRQRIKRGTIEHEKVDGTVYVLVGGDGTRQDTDRTTDRMQERAELVEELRDRVAFLERELERRGNELEQRGIEATRYQEIVVGLTQANARLSARVPELPAASYEEPREPPESAREGEPGTNTTPASASPQTGAQPRSWWRRLIGFDR